MIDETEGSGSEPPANGQEASLGGASEWSTVPPSSYTPPAATPAQAQPPANPSLEPLPQPVSYGSPAASVAPSGPPVPPQPYTAGPAPSQQGYQPVYGSGQQPPPGAYASAPGSGYPPQGPPPPPGYGAPGTPGGPVTPGGPGYPPPPGAGQGLSSHAAAAISYITFIPAVIFLVMAPYNRDRFVKFHAWQCIALTVVAVGFSILFTVMGLMSFHLMWWMFMLIRMLVRLVLFVFWLIALIKASQGQWFKIPIVGDLAQSFAGKA